MNDTLINQQVFLSTFFVRGIGDWNRILKAQQTCACSSYSAGHTSAHIAVISVPSLLGTICCLPRKDIHPVSLPHFGTHLEVVDVVDDVVLVAGAEPPQHGGLPARVPLSVRRHPLEVARTSEGNSWYHNC